MMNQYSDQPRSVDKESFIPKTDTEKTTALHDELQDHLDPVIQTDLDFLVTDWNESAEKMYGLPSAKGKNIFEIVNVSFMDGSVELLKKQLGEKGNWQGEIIYHRHDGVNIYFRSAFNYMMDENEQPLSIVILNHNITHEKLAEKKLAETEATYQSLVNTLLDGVMMLGPDGKITACNKRAADILDVPRERLFGKVPVSHSWKIFKPDGRKFPDSELPAIVSLQTGFPQKNVRLRLEKPDGTNLWLSVSSQALIRQGEFNPYAVVVSFSDINESVKNEIALQKTNERFFYSSKVTSDAIWDIDLETNEIYRSETFYPLSGYSPEQIGPAMDWWFTKVHPDDRSRVKNKVDEYIRKGLERWEDEYRFECADGSYKYLYDTGLILYKNKKPVRLTGAIRDITKQRKREQQLLNEQEQRYKLLSEAAIAEKENETTRTNKKIHDTLNKILVRAESYMKSAQADPGNAAEMLHKAMECHLQAQEEIRKLVK